MGFYGVNCLDCNHNCHPEMHPYEWTWWLNLQDSMSRTKTWLVGLFHEGSNRFPNWSQNPMTGEISIPFAFDVSENGPLNVGIDIDHLVFNKFEEEGLKLMHLGETIPCNENYQEISFGEIDSVQQYIVIRFNNILKTEGLKYWFSDVNLDKENSIFCGYFHLATSVKDLYTTRITFNQTYDY